MPLSSIASWAAFKANCTKRGVLLKSLTDKKSGGVKSPTSPAIRESNSLASKWVIFPTPLWPLSKDFQKESLPMPTELTTPHPVTATRRIFSKKLAFFLANFIADVFDCFADGSYFLGILIGNFYAEFLF